MEHWLFLLNNGRMHSVCYDDQNANRPYEYVYIRGKAEADYQDDFWNRWEQNSGFARSTHKDSKFCICVGTQSPEFGKVTLPHYVNEHIGDAYRIWSKGRIYSALEAVGYPYHCAFYGSKGTYQFDFGEKKEKHLRLTIIADVTDAKTVVKEENPIPLVQMPLTEQAEKPAQDTVYKAVIPAIREDVYTEAEDTVKPEATVTPSAPLSRFDIAMLQNDPGNR